MKANLAIEAMDTDGKLDGIKVLGLFRLNNRGLVYEMDTEESADWLRGREAAEDFTNKFGANIVIKQRKWTAVAPFVPITFEVGDRGRLRVAEQCQVDEKDIMEVRWMKLERLRKQGQRVALLGIACSLERALDRVLGAGKMWLEGKYMDIRQNKTVPQRCHKCQKITTAHISSMCPSQEEVCGTCMGNHRTRECTVTDYRQFACANCKARGMDYNHIVWNVMCPSLWEKGHSAIQVAGSGEAAREARREVMREEGEIQEDNIEAGGQIRNGPDNGWRTKGPNLKGWDNTQKTAPQKKERKEKGNTGKVGGSQKTQESQWSLEDWLSTLVKKKEAARMMSPEEFADELDRMAQEERARSKSLMEDSDPDYEEDE